jgi:hypothetical protein
MKKRDAYPSKYFKATDFPDKPMVLKIEMTRLEPFENNGKSEEKLVMYFVGQKSGLVVGPTVWEQIADVTGSDDTEDWPGHWLELYRDKTPFGGKMVDCIRVRKPGTPPPSKGKAKKPKPDPKPDFDDAIPD